MTTWPVTPLGSRISIHTLGPGQTIPKVRKAKERGLVWPVVKSVGNAGIILDTRAIEPRTRTILRFVNLNEDSAQGVDTWTSADMTRHAAAALEAQAGRLSADELAAADWLEPLNEADPPGVLGWSRFGQYLGIMADLATARGLHIAVPGTNRGTPEWAEMLALVESGCFARLKRGGHIWTAHEGGDGPGSTTPIDVGFGARIPGAPYVARAGALAFRYRYLYHLLEERGEVVPLFISEFYPGALGPVPGVLDRLRWYDLEGARDYYLLGFAPYTFDAIQGWFGEDFTYMADGVLDYMAQQQMRPNGSRPAGPPDPRPAPAPVIWTRGVCLAGVHSRADGRAAESDLAAIERARGEAVLLLTTAAPAEALAHTAAGRFVLVRLFEDFRSRRITAADFVSWQAAAVEPYYNAGVRYFQVHNEPNLVDEGLGQSWTSGLSFAAWFVAVREALRARFPLAQFGFPGVSPGGDLAGVRMDAEVFLDGAAAAAAVADFIGVHCYWQSPNRLEAEADGGYYRTHQRRYPNKLLFITEFANTGLGVAPDERGRQYAQYYRQLRYEPHLGAAFSFVLSASDPGFRHMAWRSESGALSPLVDRVAAGMGALVLMPPPGQEAPMSDAARKTVGEVAASLRQQADILEGVAHPNWWSTLGQKFTVPAPGKQLQFYLRGGRPYSPAKFLQVTWPMDVTAVEGNYLLVSDPAGEERDLWVDARDLPKPA